MDKLWDLVNITQSPTGMIIYGLGLGQSVMVVSKLKKEWFHIGEKLLVSHFSELEMLEICYLSPNIWTALIWGKLAYVHAYLKVNPYSL